jgi:hypothetical protein
VPQPNERERNLFALSVGVVTPLPKKNSSLRTPGPNPCPSRRQRTLDEASVLVEALSDDFDVESLLDTDAALSFGAAAWGLR